MGRAGLMLVGCGMMTTSVPTMITASLTGTLPGASDFRSTSGTWSQKRASTGRVLLSGGATAATGMCRQNMFLLVPVCLPAFSVFCIWPVAQFSGLACLRFNMAYSTHNVA